MSQYWKYQKAPPHAKSCLNVVLVQKAGRRRYVLRECQVPRNQKLIFDTYLILLYISKDTSSKFHDKNDEQENEEL